MKRTLFAAAFAFLALTANAQTSLTIDVQKKHQKITGFGAFVCSPQFTYNHMTDAEIEKVWKTGAGKIGCNIIRLYIPIGKNSWSQSLATAKKAKQLGLIVFASPWGQPSEWKTNGTINAMDPDGTKGYLKKENWPDYAQYLEDYVQYLRTNGVELDAISIQNEPDWKAKYAGCLWSASDIAEFVKTYGKSISCKVMAPETLGISDSYANALNQADVLDCFDIYGGHQYGGLQSAYKNLASKGKELWMTEYLINWDEAENTTRDWNFQKDFFNFFQAINVCMLGDFNAWIHYAAKRYYGLISDGQKNVGTSGNITKRGRIMSHFARFVTGYTRVDGLFTGSGLSGSAYLSPTGDTVVAVVANQNTEEVTLKTDLPFYTKKVTQYYTNETKNMASATQNFDEDTFRPETALSAQSVNTLIFIRSKDRQVSNMTASVSFFDRSRLDDLTTTNTSFGTTYMMSGKTKAFDVSNPLISSRTTTTYGYVKLNETYTQLVLHVNSISSTYSYTIGAPTLYYVNKNGAAVSHAYDRINMDSHENFDLVFDLSSATLKDGCKGLLSLTCDNSASHLTITFGDVYLTKGGSLYAATMGGEYVADDGRLFDYSTDPCCTSINLTAVTALPASFSWIEGTNKVVYAAAGSELSGTNVVKDGVCASLVVNEANGAFRPATAFTATTAAYICQVDGQHIVTLPFAASIPAGVTVYQLDSNLQPTAVTTAPAGVPLLVEAQGTVTFTGSGEVSYFPQTLTDAVLPISTPTAIRTPRTSLPVGMTAYNLMGQKVYHGYRDITVVNGKKYIKR